MTKRTLTLMGMAMLWALPFFVLGQTIPRAGFPYCEGFIDIPPGGVNNIDFTVADGEGTFNGNPFTPYLTGQGLRLTESGNDLRGWVYVDLPFSPTYGIKTSFEYFIHTPSNTGLGDGFSFFLFDGAINKSSFEIGGFGGSLGYAPLGSNTTGVYTSTGLKGGYMGIGFDVLGNFGNYQEKKFGGFHNKSQFNFSTPSGDIKVYPNAVSIRGPVAIADANRDNGAPLSNTPSPPYSSYQFVDGEILHFEPSETYGAPYPGYYGPRVNNGSRDLYADPLTRSEFFIDAPDMFKLSEGLLPGNFNCATRPDGYRKVFIDLFPNPGNPTIPYKISVYILKDQDATPTLILDDVDYPYPIPAGVNFLKLGFAASTGSPFYSAIDIRNVAALVSSVEDENKPAPPVLSKEICIDDVDQVEFPFCVDLADENTFIQCVQLMDAYEDADNDFSDDFLQCEQPGFCDQRCREALKTLPVNIGGELVGTFYADLSDEVAVGEFNQANITFERNSASSFYGTFTRYYKIVDNFGLESDAIPITITINPKPRVVFEGTPLDPTCNGQNDGTLSGVIVDRLAENYTLEFYDASGPVTATLVSEVLGADGYFVATFDLSGLNLGEILVRAVNPTSATLGPVCANQTVADPAPCEIEDVLVYKFEQESGTPVELLPYQEIICEQNDAVISPSIDPVYNPNGLPVPFQWYADDAGTQLLNSGAATVDGVAVTIAVATDGTLTVTGLTADGLNPKTYTFYVETLFQNNSGSGAGNFCPYLGTVATEATITVYPAIDIQIVETPDWCRASAGAIAVTAQGGTGSKTFNLYQLGSDTPIQSQVVTGTQHTFSNLLPGDYEVEVITQNPNCTNLVTPITIEGPAESLALTQGPTVEEYCSLANGSLQFTLTGGNLPYNSITVGGVDIHTLDLTQAGDVYLVEGLTGGSYAIEVRDAQGCPISISMTVASDVPSEYGTIPDEICEGQTATVQAEIIDQSTSTPSFAWYASDGVGGYVAITTSSTFDGGTFAFDAATHSMSVSGLAASATPYTYYLQVTGTKVCDQGYIPVEIQVNSGPEMEAPELTQIDCFGAANGAIQAVLPSGGNLADFQFSLSGDNGVAIGFTSNNGLFENLAPGIYSLSIQNAAGCISTLDDLVITEPTELILQTTGSIVEPTCGEDNGTWTFSVRGGTPDASGEYALTLDGAAFSSLGTNLVEDSPGNFTISGLSPGAHLIEATDANSCVKALNETFTAQAVPDFDTEDEAICEGESATLIPQIIDQAGSTPAFTWSYEDPASPGNYIVINSGDQAGGATFTLSNGELIITGLVYQSAPYVYYLNVSGDKVCPEAPIPAEVRVMKLPEAQFAPVSVSCFGGNDGAINLVSSDPAVNMTYTILETGASNTTGNFTGLAAADYTIEIQEQGAPCNATVSVTVDEPAELQVINPKSQNPTCGASNGSISFEIAGGTPDYVVLINGSPLSGFTGSLVANIVEVKNLDPGNYSVHVTDGEGCVVSESNLFVLTNDAGIDVSINSMEHEVCVGSDVVLLPVFQTSPPITPNFNWYKDAALTQPITSSPTPDADGVAYQIAGGTGQLTITGLAEASYSFYLEISGAGICTSVNEAKALINPPIVSSLEAEPVTCFGLADGSITVSSTGGNGAYEYSLNGGAFGSASSFVNLPAGTYTLTVRNSLGCTETQTVEVPGPPSAIQTNTPDLLRSSCDLNNGTISNLVISGGWGDYSVEWRKDSPTGTVVPGDATGASDLAPGTYYLIVADREGCTAEFDFEIEESSDPVYAVVPPIDACTGTPVSIRPIHIAPNPSLPPAAATEVRWYTEPGQTGLIQDGGDPSMPSVSYTIDDADWLNPVLEIDGLPAGSHDYYFYVVCTGQEIKIDVTVYDTPAVVLSTDTITCYGDTDGRVSITSGALPTYTYSVNGAAPISQATFEALNLGAGDYTLVVGTPAGCEQNLDFTIGGPDAALAISPLVGINPGCGAPNGKLGLEVTGGVMPYSLEVLKGGVSQGVHPFSQNDITLDGYTPGVYQVVVTDANGCSLTTNTVTLVDGPTQVLVDDQEICVGADAVLSPSLDPAAAGASFHWYFDAGLTQPIASSASPAADGRIYQINTSSGTLTISNLPEQATVFTYYVTASGSGVCPGFVGSGEVRVFGVPSATSSVQNEVCFGDGGQIIIAAAGGSGSYTYSLNGGAFGASNVFDVATGTHTVEVMTAEGCSVLLTGILVSGPSSALSVSNVQQDNPTCDQNNGAVRFDLAGGYAPYTITYTKDGISAGNISLTSPGQVVLPDLAEGTYTFGISDSEGCAISLPNSITLVEVPTLIAVDDVSICLGDDAVLTPTLPQNIINPAYSWSFDVAGNSPIADGQINGITYAIAPNGELTITGLDQAASPYTYYVTASGPGICNIVAEPATVSVAEIASLRVSNPSVVCDPSGSVDLTDYIEGFNPNVYDYNVLSPSGNAMQMGELENVAVPGDYRVSSSVKGSNCWNAAQRIRVLIAEELLVADFEYEVDLGNGSIVTGGDIQIQENVQFQDLSVGNAILWNWDFGDGSSSSQQNPIHQYLTKGTYTVKLQVIDNIGCVSEFEIVVNVFDDYLVIIPNAFTPDGVKNRYFKPEYRGIASMDFYIFNTWGELVYHATSLEDQGWDGMLNNVPVPNGNYVYRGKFTSRSGENFERAGTFILIR